MLQSSETFRLLYVAGQTPRSVGAFTNLKKIIGDLSNCERVRVGLELRPR